MISGPIPGVLPAPSGPLVGAFTVDVEEYFHVENLRYHKIVLLMGGGSGWNLLVTGASLTSNVVLNLLLIPRYGMNGAAVAYAISIVFDNVATALLVWRLFGLHPFGRGYWLAVAGGTACYGGVGLVVSETR